MRWIHLLIAQHGLPQALKLPVPHSLSVDPSSSTLLLPSELWSLPGVSWSWSLRISLVKFQNMSSPNHPNHPLPETNSKLAPENGFRWKTRTFPFGAFRPIFRGKLLVLRGEYKSKIQKSILRETMGNHSWNSTRPTSEKWNKEASSVMILSCPWIRLLEFNSFPWTMPNSRHPNLLSVVLKVGAAKFHITSQ